MLASTVLTRAEGILKIDRDNIGIPGLEETQLLAVLDKANADWIEAHKKGGGEPPEYMQAETGGTLISGTNVNDSSGVLTTDTTITVDDSSEFPSSGAIVTYENDMPDVHPYTGNTANVFSGVTGIGFDKSDNAAVYNLYALPTDFRDLREEDGYKDGLIVEGSEFRFVSGDPGAGQFTIYDNAGTKYLWFPRDLSGDYSVIYNKTTTTIDDTTDTVDIPDTEPENQWYLVWRLVAYGREVLGVDGIDLAESRAIKILADELKKRTQGKRVKLASRRIDMSSDNFRVSFYNPRAGVRGFYR